MHMPPATLLLLALALPAVQAAPNDGRVGAYARVEVGASHFKPSGASAVRASDDRGQALKVFAGYRFDEQFGLELGVASLGHFRQTVKIDGLEVEQSGRAYSVFAVATARLPLGEDWAGLARAGLSSGRVRGEGLGGGRTSPTLGLGIEYRPRPNIALSLNHDRYGELSDQVEASAVVFGFHLTL